MGIERVLDRVVVGRGGDNHKIGVGISVGSVGCSPEVKVFSSQILLDIFVLDR